MNKKINLLIVIILFSGILYRLALTWDGNFLFNMDNGRDMVDVREMVETGKLRLTGPPLPLKVFIMDPPGTIFWQFLMFYQEVILMHPS